MPTLPPLKYDAPFVSTKTLDVPLAYNSTLASLPEPAENACVAVPALRNTTCVWLAASTFRPTMEEFTPDTSRYAAGALVPTPTFVPVLL